MPRVHKHWASNVNNKQSVLFYDRNEFRQIPCRALVFHKERTNNLYIIRYSTLGGKQKKAVHNTSANKGSFERGAISGITRRINGKINSKNNKIISSYFFHSSNYTKKDSDGYPLFWQRLLGHVQLDIEHLSNISLQLNLEAGSSPAPHQGR